MVENENNANELENNSNETEEETEKDSQSEANETKTETGTELDEQKTESDEDLTEELKPTYTSDLIETDNFTLQVEHYMTAGDMLVSTLLAANIAVMLLCRLLRDRK